MKDGLALKALWMGSGHTKCLPQLCHRLATPPWAQHFILQPFALPAVKQALLNVGSYLSALRVDYEDHSFVVKKIHFQVLPRRHLSSLCSVPGRTELPPAWLHSMLRAAAAEHRRTHPQGLLAAVLPGQSRWQNTCLALQETQMHLRRC